MLVELNVSHFAIIDQLHIPFQKGLNILSGETGAGKSVILKSLALLMGEKALADIVRSGSEQAIVEGRFDISRRPDIFVALGELGLPCEEDQLIVRRILSTQGKSRVYLNGALCPLNLLKDLISPLITLTGPQAPLIELTGQHDNKNLQSKSYHLDLLDRYAGAWPLRTELSEHVVVLKDIQKELHELETQSLQRMQRLDFLIFQRDEIAALNLQPGEETEIEARLSRLKNSTRLADYAGSVEAVLYTEDQSVLAQLHAILQKGQELKSVDESLDEKLQAIGQAKALLEDQVFEFRSYLKDLDADPEELHRLQDRLSSIRKLEKKFGDGVERILQVHADLSAEIDTIESSDEKLEALRHQQKELESKVAERCLELHQRRLQAAVLLQDSVNEELLDLNMKGLQFLCSVTQLPNITHTGFCDVEFKIQAGSQDTPRPLARFASGGELSRILLALKRVCGQSDQPRTYLFDEVDTGVSGQTAEKVGRKLKSIAKNSQVICVTHLPQVAAFGDVHFLIEKSVTRKGSLLKVNKLASEDRIQELARLLSGEKITKTSVEHAKSLLKDLSV